MSKQTGGPAFPNKASGCGGSSLDSNGMTLRDYFAAQAMQSILTNEHELQRIRNHYIEAYQVPAIVAMSYRLADAMIAERNK